MKRFIIGALVVLAAVQAALIVLFRVRPAGAMTVIRRFNRDVINPKVLEVAGESESEVAVVHHVGRRSSRSYDTPVLAAPTNGGFVVPLPYGTEVDWLQNVMATGGATLDLRGTPYVVVNPRIVAADSEDVVMAPKLHSRMRPFGVDEYLQFDRIDRISTEEKEPAGTV